MLDTVRDVVRSPVAWGSGIFGAGALGMLDPVIQLLNATASAWLPLVLMSEQLASYVDWIPQDAVGALVPIVLAIYIALLANRLINRTRDFFDSRS